MVAIGNETRRLTFASAPTGPADPVNVVFGFEREVEIDDVGDVVDVDSASRDVGRDEDPVSSRLKIGQGLFAVGLRTVRMEESRVVDESRMERAPEPRNAVLRSGEDDNRAGLFLEEPNDLVHLVFFADLNEALIDLRLLFRGDTDLYLFRRVHHVPSELFDRRRKGRGEHQSLARFRNAFGNPGELVGETHVEHSVGFVENQRLNEIEPNISAFEVIAESARRRDDDLGIFTERGFFEAHIRAADQHRRLQSERSAEGFENRSRLLGNFSGRRKREDERSALSFIALDRREYEAGRFSTPGRGGSEDVETFDRRRNRGGLNRCRRFVADFPNRLEDDRVETEVFPFGSHWMCDRRRLGGQDRLFGRIFGHLVFGSNSMRRSVPDILESISTA